MKPYTVAVIFARGGSKGVPRKNVREMAGKPLIAYAIEIAHSSSLIDRVIVSTDDGEIADVAKQYGADVPFMRPSELAKDDSPEWLSWQHAIRTLQETGDKKKIDVFVSLPTTSPLRKVKDVDACIGLLLEGEVDAVITVRPAERNPYFNMVVTDSMGYAQLAIKPDNVVQRRQSAPPMFDITTVAYAARPEFVLNSHSLFEGRVKSVVVPAERAIDIDTELDFKIAEFLITNLSNEEDL